MSRRHQTIHVGLQPPEDSIDIPPLLPPRQKTSRFALYSRSHCSQPCSLPETPSSQNLSQAASRLELICTTETCNNSESCMRTFSDFCPEGLREERKESGQCSDSCQNNMKASNARLSQDHICTKETCNSSQSCMRTYLENLERIKKESRQCSESCQNKKASNTRGHAPPHPRPSSATTTCDATCRHSTRGTRPSSDRRTCGGSCRHAARESKPSCGASYGLSTEGRTRRASCGYDTRELRPNSDSGACPPAILITTVRQSESLLRMMSSCCEANRSQNSRCEYPIKSLTNQPTHKQFNRASSEMKTSCCPPTTTNHSETYPPKQRVNNAYSDMPRDERPCCKEPDPIIQPMDSPTRNECCFMDAGTQSVPATKTISTCATSKTKQLIHNKLNMPDIEENCKSDCMRSPVLKERTGCYIPPEPCPNFGVGRNLKPEPEALVAPVKGDSILDNIQLRNELFMKLKDCCEEDVMTSQNSCCKKDSKVKKGLSEEDRNVIRDICREDMVLGNSPSNENVKEKKIPCPCPETEEPQEVQNECSCHFPPAFNQYGCTGNISGNCNCASGD